MNALVELRGYTLERNGAVILRNIDLVIQPGERVALVGPSGAGKSSLLLALYELLRDQAALCPQQLGLVDALSAYHNIYMARLERHSLLANLCNLLYPLPGPRREVGQLAKAFAIEPLLRRRVVSLSGGERQRVALARACYRGLPVFLGDEPVSSVDPDQGGRLLAQVCERHATVVAALHSPEQALQNFQRVIGLQGGAVAFDCPAQSMSQQALIDFYRDP
ncbi:ATP-binding cassette domain-containing protein [Haliea sp. E17]|uniref:ATP-binding cassette domain-containing protein n=1 Tax=Haliea sp. E17 TaxID=3401576 RepID=UPI003AAE64AC